MPLKKSSPNITVHTIVKNEDRWIWYAIKSIIDFVDKIIIFDTGSTDRTVSIIKSIKSPKIIFKQKGNVTRKSLVALRRQQLALTKTNWFMLLDGDEIWPKKNLKNLIDQASKCPEEIIALYTRTRNCIGDIYHYLPESKGRYKIGNQTGHLNIRLIRNHPNIDVAGLYPLEAYTLDKQPIQQLTKAIKYVDTWYLHTTHLSRSTNNQAEKNTIDRIKKKKTFRFSKKMKQTDLPEVFQQPRPKIVPPPINSFWKTLLSI